MTCKICLTRLATSLRSASATPIRSSIPRTAQRFYSNVDVGPSRIAGSASGRSWLSRSKAVDQNADSRLRINTRSYASASMASTSGVDPSTFPPPTQSSQSGIRVTPPSLEAIKEEGYLDDDVQLIPEHEATMIVTPEAIKQLERITSKEPADVLAKGKLALRVGVESGGCHGYQYTMDLTEERGVDDYVLQPEGVNCIPVVVDLVSLGLLKGATLHHATELIGSSFRLQNNPQAKDNGACGCGVSWELK